MRARSLKLTSLLLLTMELIHFKAAAQTNASTPYGYGTVFNGFQDNFTNAIRDPGRLACPILPSATMKCAQSVIPGDITSGTNILQKKTIACRVH